MQDSTFKSPAKVGDFFYLCYANDVLTFLKKNNFFADLRHKSTFLGTYL